MLNEKVQGKVDTINYFFIVFVYFPCPVYFSPFFLFGIVLHNLSVILF